MYEPKTFGKLFIDRKNLKSAIHTGSKAKIAKYVIVTLLMSIIILLLSWPLAGIDIAAPLSGICLVIFGIIAFVKYYKRWYKEYYTFPPKTCVMKIAPGTSIIMRFDEWSDLEVEVDDFDPHHLPQNSIILSYQKREIKVMFERAFGRNNSICNVEVCMDIFGSLGTLSPFLRDHHEDLYSGNCYSIFQELVRKMAVDVILKDWRGFQFDPDSVHGGGDVVLQMSSTLENGLKERTECHKYGLSLRRATIRPRPARIEVF